MPTHPEQLGSYRLIEKLGQGGMAQVFRGERTAEAGFKKKVAIKRMLPQYRRDPALLERFAAEARTNARLDHPNLVQVLDFGIEPEPYLVLEFIEGVPLANLLQRMVAKHEKLEISAALYMGSEAAQGLDYAHRKKDEEGKPLGIVHRDVSPQNVLVSNEGAVKVSDFGLVKAADNVVKTASGVSIGKLSYMSPEQAAGDEVDARADVFSLGVVVWEMLTLRALIPHNDVERASRLLKTCDFPKPSHYNPEVPERLDKIIMACLKADPNERTPSMQALSLDLRELLHELAPGYGREQLARLVNWAFEEHGWEMEEPHLPPAQPSEEERASMAPVTPAVEAAKKAAESRIALEQAVEKKRSALPLPWIAILAAAGAIALLGILTLAVVIFVTSGDDDDEPRTPPPVTTGLIPPSTATPTPGQAAGQALVPQGAAGFWLAANVPNAAIYLGARRIGQTPMQIQGAQLDGSALVVIAAGHQPVIISPEELSSRVTGGGRQNVALSPAAHPDLVVFVATPGLINHGQTHSFLGRGPGIVRVPVVGGARPPLELRDPSGTVHHIDISGCMTGGVCQPQAQ